MNNLLTAVFFGAGVAAFAYSRMGRRVGYGNTGNMAVMVGVIFLMASIFFYTIITTFIKLD